MMKTSRQGELGEIHSFHTRSELHTQNDAAFSRAPEPQLNFSCLKTDSAAVVLRLLQEYETPDRCRGGADDKSAKAKHGQLSYLLSAGLQFVS